eukprot:CAMPEP_0198143828 /NCGR_PEP_ID=MMETSP1443-20131203/10643_1 /TAXON_ID=186043 /ORGANISM="Entomoneis sp., Strain CCMP2396" /LENGTH=38 /DNA_ID= /DNA_START= /DNA_END= /DNA_ORIENTATION=
MPVKMSPGGGNKGVKSSSSSSSTDPIPTFTTSITIKKN